jgi:hypothetical protein
MYLAQKVRVICSFVQEPSMELVAKIIVSWLWPLVPVVHEEITTGHHCEVLKSNNINRFASWLFPLF